MYICNSSRKRLDETIQSRVSNHFIWQEEYKPDFEVFLDRTFELLMKTEEKIKFSIKLSYDNPPIVVFRVKAVQGESLIDEKFTINLKYQYGGH